METATKSALVKSIEALSDYDFDCVSGFSTKIYLNPEAEKIEVFQDSNNSMPMKAYHHEWLHICNIPSVSVPDSVVSALLEIEDALESAIESYEGTEWNGSNHVGQWSWNEDDSMHFAQLTSELSFASYWEPGDWFESCMGELKKEWESGKTAEQIIDGQHLGDSADGMCDRPAAIEWLEDEIAQWVADAE